MPLVIPDQLPALELLRSEGVFAIAETRAIHQDIRPLKLAILNLMPLKIDTENQLLRMLSNSPLQVEIQLLKTKSYAPRNTSRKHLEMFYKTLEEIEHSKYDGLIITGAPVEHIEFEAVDYWDEIRQIMDWSVHNATSTLYICWAAQAALYHFYGIPKHHLENKLFGVFEHTILNHRMPIVRGFDDVFVAPHSRHTEVRKEDILKASQIELVAESEKAGVYLAISKNGKQIFVTGHSEYDPLTLKKEYERDLAKDIEIRIPEHYFGNDDPSNQPIVNWRSHSHLLFSNWLNYYVYQVTPYNPAEIR